MTAPRRPRLLPALLLVALALGGAACGRRETSGNPGGTAAAAPEEGWPLTGEIVEANLGRQVLVVSHDEIKGFMPAMTMEFKVSAADLAAAKPGARIRGRLVQSGTDFYLEKIWPDDATARRTVEEAAKTLQQETRIRGKDAYREVGEAAPDFALYDQDGRVVQPGQFRGKRVVLNFIFTRCPVPTMCPAATLKMQALQKAAQRDGVADLELLSISLDPAYDSPAILKAYAAERGIDLTNYRFLTGPEAAVRSLLTQFGVLVLPGESVAKHTLATLLIDEQGRIVHREDGSSWEIESFLSRLRKR